MTQPHGPTAPQPRIQRLSMVPAPWAGHPFLRPLRRLLGYRAPQPWRSRSPARPLMLRRVLLLVLVALGAFVGTDYMGDVLPKQGESATEMALLVLFATLFAWISAGFWTGLMGAWVMLRGHDPQAVTNVLRGEGRNAGIPADARTAVIMPICNEHVATVFGGMRATFESLRATAWAERFDFFVLSDTSNPDIRAAEQAAWGQLVQSLESETGGETGGAPVRLHYRWRQHRSKRKAGNVADFCRRFARAYRYMVVLDADSVMTGDCLVSLVQLMEAHPDAGIVQTAPRASGHSTLHARIQQFGARVYGPLFTAGMHFWQLGESHYWGHNAILRVAPFTEHCALAPLSGKTSLSGDVMSHDFVEAALMRRAGWKVWIAHDLEGSYEQLPPNLLAELQRDRRWCHGNLQNSRLMFEPGLHPVHRTVFLTGVLAYVSAPLWLGFLLLSSLLFAHHSNEVPRYFFEPRQLFPMWPNANLKLMLTLFGLTALLLLAPKVLSLALIVAKGQARRFGGVARLLIGALLEFFHSLLLAPVRMLFHTQFVLAALTGWKLDWKSPPREDAATSWREAARRHGWHTALALAWVGALLVGSAAVPWWLSPVIVGLLLAIPLSAGGSRSGPGRWLRARGVLLIPEETHRPAVLASAARHALAFARPLRATDAVVEASAHHDVTRAIVARPSPAGLKAQSVAQLVDHACSAGPKALTPAQLHRLLGDAHALAGLRNQVLLHRAHPDWWVQRPAQAPRASTATGHGGRHVNPVSVREQRAL
jgi:membrane glycosyltransferase